MPLHLELAKLASVESRRGETKGPLLPMSDGRGAP